MKANLLTEYGKISWQDLPTPEVDDNQILIKVKYAGICGSDMHIFCGDFHPRTKLPFVPGHEFAGTIADVGTKVTQFNIGDNVVVDPIIWCDKCAACQIGHYSACSSLKLLGIDMDGGFGEYVLADKSMVYKLPSNISLKHAALIEVLSIGFHACKRAEIKENDIVAIWGAGRIGHCILQAARTKTNNTIFMIDILDDRLKPATDNFPNIVSINSKNEDPLDVIQKHTQGRGVDVAFEAVGHAHPVPDRPNPVRGCVQSIRGAGMVCVLGLADDPAPLIMKELIWKEAKIVASRVSHGEFSESIKHMEQGYLKPDVLISAEMKMSEAQLAFELLEAHPEKYLKIILKADEID